MAPSMPKFGEGWSAMNLARKFSVVAILLVAVVALILSTKLLENVKPSEVLVVQNPMTGTMSCYSQPGIKWQGFGHITKYSKLQTYEFQIPVRFNDGGHGTVEGSINYEIPLDKDHLTELLQKYGDQESVQKRLIEVVTNKCVYMTGPLMSSKESYAEKRTSLIFYIEDQITNGVYKTTQEEVVTKDVLTGADKTITVAKIVMGKDGKAERQEEPVLTAYGIHTSNFAVTKLPYDQDVEEQIKQQQKITMAVQTAMAKAKEAEQNTITVGKEGEAEAARAKWLQEKERSKAVVEAQQKLDVAVLGRKAAEQEKMKEILLGEGEGTHKRLVMQADGALEKKLETYEKVSQMYANAIEKHEGPWTPSIVMGGDGRTSAAGSGASGLLDLFTAKVAKELSLDMHMSGKTSK